MRPKIGWVRSIRKALGMTIKQLAKRLGVDPSRIVKIKTAEIRDAVTLHTLKMVAEKLDCSFVYALVPSTSLKEAIESKAEALAKEQVKQISHTMDLETQWISGSADR